MRAILRQVLFVLIAAVGGIYAVLFAASYLVCFHWQIEQTAWIPVLLPVRFS